MTVTAAILIVGNEILSGKTQDANAPWLALRLAERGILLREIRVVRDEPAAIIDAVRALSSAYTHVFSTGGIGPTHDDITADAMAAAFAAPIDINAEARARLTAYYGARGDSVTDARLRMARIPVGATLIDNPVSAAPGFTIANVHVMAGVPRIMQAMAEGLLPRLAGGPPVLSRTVEAALPESAIAESLARAQGDFPDVEIGSYPQMSAQGPRTALVLRGQDEARLNAAAIAVQSLVDAALKG